MSTPLVDRVDLAGAVSGWNGTVRGMLRVSSFNADLTAAVSAALAPTDAVLFNPDTGDMRGQSFLVVDGNGDGDYTAGQDHVFELIAPAAPLRGTTMFFIQRDLQSDGDIRGVAIDDRSSRSGRSRRGLAAFRGSRP